MTMTRADALAAELPAYAVLLDERALAADVLAALSRGSARPALRWLPSSVRTLDGITFASHPTELWIRSGLGERLTEVVAHEARHSQQFAAWGVLSTRHARFGTDCHRESDATAFGLLVRALHRPGRPCPVELLPAVEPPPPGWTVWPMRPQAARASPPSRPGVIVREPARKSDRVPITIGGRIHFTCHGCSRRVPVETRHACPGGRRTDDG